MALRHAEPVLASFGIEALHEAETSARSCEAARPRTGTPHGMGVSLPVVSSSVMAFRSPAT
jgi:hypothetical protein